MSFVTAVDAARQIGTIRLTGTVRAEEVLEAAAELYNDPAWRAGYGILWDGTGLTVLVVHPSDVEQFVAFAAAYRHDIGPGRTAWVFAREMDNLVAGHLFSQLKQPNRERQGFADVDEALAWLQKK